MTQLISVKANAHHIFGFNLTVTLNKPEQKAMIQLQVAKSLTHSLTHSYMNDITCKLHRKCSSWRVLDFPTQGKKYLLYRCPYLKEVRVRMGSAPRVENSPNHLPEKLRCTIGNIY